MVDDANIASTTMLCKQVAVGNLTSQLSDIRIESRVPGTLVSNVLWMTSGDGDGS